MSEEMYGRQKPLPPGWAWAKLGELCEIVGGITVDAKRQDDDWVEVPYLRWQMCSEVLSICLL
jgi:hypothetical protein